MGTGNAYANASSSKRSNGSGMFSKVMDSYNASKSAAQDQDARRFEAAAGIVRTAQEGKNEVKRVKATGKEQRKNMRVSSKVTNKTLEKGSELGLSTVSADHSIGKVNAKYGKQNSGGGKKSGKKNAVKLGRSIAEGMFELANERRNPSGGQTRSDGSGEAAKASTGQGAISSPRRALAAGSSKKKKTASEIIAKKTSQQNARTGSPERSTGGAIVSKQGPKRINGAIPALQRGKLRGAKLNRPY